MHNKNWEMKKMTHNPAMLLNGVIRRLFGRWMSDKIYLKLLYPYKMGEKLDLEHPRSFSEKLQWIKINDRKPFYHTMVDKVESKKYIDRVIGSGHTIPTLGVWNSFEEIDWESLPQEFILKTTHDSSSYYIVHDKQSMDIDACRKKLYQYWGKDYYKIATREWPYKGVQSRILAEPLIKDSSAPYLRDFKFYCFNGEPRIFYITSDKGGDLPTRQDFFDIKGNPIDLEDVHFTKNPVKAPDLPAYLDDMIETSRMLSRGMYHLRVDFYETKETYYVGELTFFEDGGFCRFKPDYWNKKLGDWIKLPTDK